MFELVAGREVASRGREALLRALSPNARRVRQRLSNPSGAFDADILVRKDLDMWAYIAPEAFEDNRYMCWFGVGEPSWQPTIEINIPLVRTLRCSGQLVRDERGRLYLSHRGGLGGGKFSVTSGAFADLIQNFDQDTVRDGDTEHQYFVLGQIGHPELLPRLAGYVHEADRIRRLRRNEVAFREALHVAGGQIRDGKALGGEFTTETEGDGSYVVNRRVAFRRLHAKVQKALAAELAERGLAHANGRLSGGIGPDVYIHENGTMKSLFEIKVGRDAQSIFTAIGQLIVYSAGVSPAPRRILVTQGLPASPLFRSAINQNGIELLFYHVDGHDVVFRDIPSFN